MKKLTSIVALALLFAAGLRAQGQNPITASQVTTPIVNVSPASTVAQVTDYHGRPNVYGTTPYYYWFVSRTSSSVSTPAGPLIVNSPSSLSSLNSITITWTPLPSASGVTSYDVLRTSTTTVPSGACSCGLALATGLTQVTDTGAALSAYTVATTGLPIAISNQVIAGVQTLAQTYNGVTTPIGSGGSSPVSVANGGTGATGFTPNCLIQGNASSPLSCSSASDNGTTLSTTDTGGFNASNGPLTSGAPPAGANGSGGFACSEAPATGWTPTAGTDYLQCNSAAHAVQGSYNGDGPYTLPRVIASGSTAMGTSAISSGACATAVTVSAAGVATTDRIAVTPNADPTTVTGYAVSASGSLYIQAYPTSGNVNFKVCNPTSGSLTPAALTLNWAVTR